VEAVSDFADLFEVKDALKKRGKYESRVTDDRLVLRYIRDTYGKETSISASSPATIDEHSLTFAVQIAPHGKWSTELDVEAELFPFRPSDSERPRGGRARRARPDMARRLDSWLANAPSLESDSERLK